MPAAGWLTTKGPNLVRSIFTGGETEVVWMKTERFGFSEGDVIGVCRTEGLQVSVSTSTPHCICVVLFVFFIYNMCLFQEGPFVDHFEFLF